MKFHYPFVCVAIISTTQSHSINAQHFVQDYRLPITVSHGELATFADARQSLTCCGLAAISFSCSYRRQSRENYRMEI